LNRIFPPVLRVLRGESKSVSLGRARSVFAAFATFAFIGVVLAGAQQPDRSQTEAMARRAGDRLQALQREADRLASEEGTLLNDLRKLEVDRLLKAEELKQVDAEARRIESDLAATSGRADALQRSEAIEAPELRARLVELYKLGQARYVRLLLSTPDIRHIGQASRMVAALASMDRHRVDSHQRTIGELKAARSALEERRRNLAAARLAAERAQGGLQRAVQARTALVRDIDARRDLNAELFGELQAAQQKLQLALRNLASGASPPDTIGLPLKPFRGDLDWPVAGVVRRRFGRASFPGIEVAAAEGTDVRAIHDGIVAFADSFSGFGNLVILDHGSQTFSLYGDLLDVIVRKGARVQRGQPVGAVGPTPGGLPGLYFELRVDGQPVDPLQWLKTKL
jgi:septal ring factor EnvC (AmiA/AmiB activator)